MKKSLRQALSLYPLFKRLDLVFLLILQKIGFRPKGKAHDTFLQLTQLVRLIENGVHLSRFEPGLLKAKVIINKREIKCLLRRGGSDLKVLESVLLQEEYKCAKDFLLTKDQVRIIIDAGANIGLTTLYLFAFFPEAKYIVIEPDFANFKMLYRNLQLNDINNVIALQKALWKNNEPLRLESSFRDGLEWSRSVVKVGSNMQPDEGVLVEAVTLSEVCDMVNDKIDLLKVDIEGAEAILFKDTAFAEQLKKFVESLVIEIHEELKIREFINNKMISFGFYAKEYFDVTLFNKNVFTNYC